jgi:hypothetical protein
LTQLPDILHLLSCVFLQEHLLHLFLQVYP